MSPCPVYDITTATHASVRDPQFVRIHLTDVWTVTVPDGPGKWGSSALARTSWTW